MPLFIALVWSTLFTLLAVTTYEGDVSCDLHSIDISYQFTNTSLECIPIEFDSALDPCNTQTQGYCYDGSNLCFIRPFYLTTIKYSLKSSSHTLESTMTLKGLNTFPNVSVVNLERTQFHCFLEVDLRTAATQLHEGHASQESLIWFIVFVTAAILFSILPILTLVKWMLNKYRGYIPLRSTQ